MELHNPLVYTFASRPALYVCTQCHLRDLLHSRRLVAVSIGLPSLALHVLVMHKNGALFAGTDSGVFRSTNNGESWEAVSTGLMKMQIHALTMSDDGRLFAGSNTGNLFVSADNGNTWQMVLSRSTTRRGLLALLPLPPTPPKPCHETSSGRSQAITSRNHSYLAAATATGVFVSADGATRGVNRPVITSRIPRRVWPRGPLRQRIVDRSRL